MVLISVAFFTLLERRLLGYGHVRMGPNKVGLIGVIQPFSDAIKLFSKSRYRLIGQNFFYYWLMPLGGLLIIIISWIIYLGVGTFSLLSISLLYLFCVIRIGVYRIFGKGWFSGSIYSILGGYRSCAQAISYEIRMAFLIILFMIILRTLHVDKFYWDFGFNLNFMVFILPFVGVWFVICLCESNRSPFDLSEGESELVSGFNTEYRGGGFSLIFISEYGSIIFLGFLTALLFFGGGFISWLIIILISFLFVHVRISYPRMRYDLLMEIAWKIILIYVIFYYFIGIYI